MKRNVGGWDRIFRFVVAIGLFVMGYVYNSYWGLLGLVPLITGLVSWCPLYIPFKKSTYQGCGASGSSCGCNKK